MEEDLQTALDELDSFKDRVYWLVEQVPRGRVATYGQIATYAGSPRAARAVGNLMRDSLANGFDCPWQRIINSNGGVSFKGDYERAALQVRLLRAEDVVFDQRHRCDLGTFRWAPTTGYWAEYGERE